MPRMLGCGPRCWRRCKTADRWRTMPLATAWQSPGCDSWHAATGVKELTSQARDSSLTPVAACLSGAAMGLPRSFGLALAQRWKIAIPEIAVRQICAGFDRHPHPGRATARAGAGTRSASGQKTATTPASPPSSRPALQEAAAAHAASRGCKIEAQLGKNSPDGPASPIRVGPRPSRSLVEDPEQKRRHRRRARAPVQRQRPGAPKRTIRVPPQPGRGPRAPPPWSRASIVIPPKTECGTQ